MWAVISSKPFTFLCCYEQLGVLDYCSVLGTLLISETSVCRALLQMLARLNLILIVVVVRRTLFLVTPHNKTTATCLWNLGVCKDSKMRNSRDVNYIQNVQSRRKERSLPQESDGCWWIYFSLWVLCQMKKGGY